jgi:parallel beta-helix repeat protein
MARALILIWAFVVAMTGPALAEGKRAFVLGNADYAALPDLENTLYDAAAYRDALAGLGYEVSFHENLDLDGMAGAMEAFVASVAAGDRVVFVYSGHGWSDSTQNYLVPIDAPATGADLKLKGASYPLRNGQDGVLDQLETSGAQLTVAIIDACRNNPFTPPKGRKSVGLTRGLVPIDAPPGTFLIYSAGEGQEALDRLPDDGGDQRLSVFSRSFVPLLASGMALEDAISEAQVMTANMAKTNDGHVQTPAYYDQALGKTCLVDGCAAGRAVPAGEQSKVADDDPSDSDDPPVLRVSANGGGDFATIRAAINAAAPGTRIEIGPGTYSDPLIIETPMELIGIGDRSQIRIAVSESHAILWTAGGGRIENLTIEQLGGDYVGLKIDGGNVVVTGNDMTSQGSTILTLRNDANPEVTANRIHDGASSGILVADGARGMFVDNVIEGNAFSGMEVGYGGAPIVRQNTFGIGAQAAIYLFDQGKGTFIGNGLAGGDTTVIVVEKSAEFEFRDNTVTCGTARGIFLSEKSGGRFVANSIDGCGGTGVEVADGSTPHFDGNKVTNMAEMGVYIHDNSGGTFVGNTVEASTSAGVFVTTGSNPTMTGNIIRAGKDAGVVISDNATGVFSGNTVEANALAGFAILSGAAPELRDNDVIKGLQVGIYIYDGGQGTVVANRVDANASAGIAIGKDSAPIVEGNVISNSGEEGVVIYEGGGGVFRGNTISGNAAAGVHVQATTKPEFIANNVHGNATYAVTIVEGGGGAFTDNDLTGNINGAFDISDQAGTVTRDNNKE